MHTSTLSLATSMPTTTRSSCAIIHSLPCLVRAQRPLQLFGLRKTPELSLALEQALSLLGRNGLSSSNGRLVGNRPFAHSGISPRHKGLTTGGRSWNQLERQRLVRAWQV